MKAVWTLELNRRENDRKTVALYVEMKDMMKVLVQYVSKRRIEACVHALGRLRNIEKDVADKQDPGGTCMTSRLEDLVRDVADDIIACGNACDTYSKKRILGRRTSNSLRVCCRRLAL